MSEVKEEYKTGVEKTSEGVYKEFLERTGINQATL